MWYLYSIMCVFFVMIFLRGKNVSLRRRNVSLAIVLFPYLCGVLFLLLPRDQLTIIVKSINRMLKPIGKKGAYLLFLFSENGTDPTEFLNTVFMTFYFALAIWIIYYASSGDSFFRHNDGMRKEIKADIASKELLKLVVAVYIFVLIPLTEMLHGPERSRFSVLLEGQSISPNTDRYNCALLRDMYASSWFYINMIVLIVLLSLFFILYWRSMIDNLSSQMKIDRRDLLIMAAMLIINCMLCFYGYLSESKNIVTSLRESGFYDGYLKESAINTTIFLLLLLLAAFAEEIVFRVVIQRKLESFSNGKITYIVGTGLFVVPHLLGNQQVVFVVSLTVFCLWQIYLKRKYRNLKIIVLYHFIWNSSIVLLTILA